MVKGETRKAFNTTPGKREGETEDKVEQNDKRRKIYETTEDNRLG